MNTIRRIYAYLLAFAGLAMVSVAAGMLAQLVLDILVQKPLTNVEEYVRNTVSLYGAAALVGLPVWLLHWRWVERTARSDPRERANILRRLYLYAILAGATLVMATSTADVLRTLFGAVVGLGSSDRLLERVIEPLPFALIACGVWLVHWRIAAVDRGLDEVGETGGSATVRRWYIYGAAFIGLVVLLNGAQGTLEPLWRYATTADGRGVAALPGPMSSALVGLSLWLVHWAVLPARLPEAARRDDGVAVLRSVYLFLGLAVGVVGALLGASQLLYYGVARLLGVDRPGGVSGNIVQAAAGPASVVLVYGAAWAYQRSAVRRQAAAFEEAPRQTGIRRLYTYLVALIGEAVLATGVSGLVWAACDVLLLGRFDADSVALFATMTVVGLPVWILHWRPLPAEADEARSLARRVYVYVSLIVATLTLVGSAAAILYRLLGLALGGGWAASVQADLAHALALAVVAAGVAAYHWRVLRADSRRSLPGRAAAAEPAQALVEIHAADAETLSRALSVLRSTGVQVTVR